MKEIFERRNAVRTAGDASYWMDTASRITSVYYIS